MFDMNVVLAKPELSEMIKNQSWGKDLESMLHISLVWNHELRILSADSSFLVMCNSPS